MKTEKPNEKITLSLDAINPHQLPELVDFKKKQLKAVKDYPFTEIVDTATAELAKKHRTALVTCRTDLDKQEKLITQKLNSFKTKVKSATEELIAITLPHEEKQQAEVKRWEKIKEDERLERQRIEEERVAGIKNKIADFFNDWSEKITLMVFASLEQVTADFNTAVEGYDLSSLAEFEVLHIQNVELLQNKLAERTAILKSAEENRLEQLRLEEVRKENEIKEQAKQSIDNFYNHWMSRINKMTLSVVPTVLSEWESAKSEKRDFGVLNAYFDEIIDAVESHKSTTVTFLQNQEQQRIDAETLAKEKLAFRTEKRSKEVIDLGFVFMDEGEPVGVLFNHPKLGHGYSTYTITDLTDDKWSAFIEEIKNEISLSDSKELDVTTEPACDLLGSEPISPNELEEIAGSGFVYESDNSNFRKSFRTLLAEFQTIEEKTFDIYNFAEWLDKNYEAPVQLVLV